MYPIDEVFILKVAPRFSGQKGQDQAEIVSAIGPVFASTLDSYDINTKLRIAHFMGQVTHECAGFRTTEEFASGAAYEGRSDLGNTQPGDGKRFKGRGLIQLTGRFNYRQMGQTLDFPLEIRPEIAGQPVISLKIACEYWKDRAINGPADEDNLIQVTKLVNGGTNGLEDRSRYLKRAKIALAEIDGLVVGQDSSVALRRGSNNDAVGELQELLRKKGFAIAVDNEFGSATELAVLEFQKRSGLKVDGVVGEDTWNALRS